MATPPGPAPANRLLARLPAEEYRRVLPRLETVPLPLGRVLHEARAAIDYAYFPQWGVTSALTVMADGTALEVATVGNEGVVGLTAAFGGGTSPQRVVVQVPGAALRMAARELRAAAAPDRPLGRLLLHYHAAYLAQLGQLAACNALHPVRQRCCRWLLMARDRVEGDDLPLTHEFLAQMLGVRRMSVGGVLRPLREDGLIDYRRGHVTVLDRPGLEEAACECYGAMRQDYDRRLGGAATSERRRGRT